LAGHDLSDLCFARAIEEVGASAGGSPDREGFGSCRVIAKALISFCKGLTGIEKGVLVSSLILYHLPAKKMDADTESVLSIEPAE
jgi:hypothetical protein